MIRTSSSHPYCDIWQGEVANQEDSSYLLKQKDIQNLHIVVVDWVTVDTMVGHVWPQNLFFGPGTCTLHCQCNWTLLSDLQYLPGFDLRKTRNRPAASHFIIFQLFLWFCYVFGWHHLSHWALMHLDAGWGKMIVLYCFWNLEIREKTLSSSWT